MSIGTLHVTFYSTRRIVMLYNRIVYTFCVSVHISFAMYI